MKNKLDVNSILKAENNRPVKIGELNQHVIDKLNLNCSPKNITVTADRFYHCETHKNQYKNKASYEESIASIPEIIQFPDYIGFNSNNNSIQYVKKLEDTTLVAVRISNRNSLALRTVFPLTDYKLNKEINSRKLIPYN